MVGVYAFLFRGVGASILKIAQHSSFELYFCV